jgi:SAM-dependent methyltransferase
MSKEKISIKICENYYIERNIRDVIDERIKPKIWQWAYLGMKPLLREIKNFSKLAQKDNAKKILDLGCGVKPYASLFLFADKFLGLDAAQNERVDLIGSVWDTSCEDNEFDALIFTQVLEHTAKIPDTVEEIRRVVKNGGLILISVPLTFPEHEIPHDYYRFTRYGLVEILKGFDIIKIIPLNGYINTLMRLWNNLLHYLPGSAVYLFPIFILNNLLAVASDKMARLLLVLCKNFCKNRIVEELYDKYYMGLTENYVIVCRNNK